jgi:hypothetical protein
MAAETEHISIPAHATWQAAGARPRTFPAGRVCERPGCSTVLSIYNRASVCSRHRVAKPRPPRLGRPRSADASPDRRIVDLRDFYRA